MGPIMPCRAAEGHKTLSLLRIQNCQVAAAASRLMVEPSALLEGQAIGFIVHHADGDGRSGAFIVHVELASLGLAGADSRGRIHNAAVPGRGEVGVAGGGAARIANGDRQGMAGMLAVIGAAIDATFFDWGHGYFHIASPSAAQQGHAGKIAAAGPLAIARRGIFFQGRVSCERKVGGRISEPDNHVVGGCPASF